VSWLTSSVIFSTGSGYRRWGPGVTADDLPEYVYDGLAPVNIPPAAIDPKITAGYRICNH
jgi:hypothetical protein